MLLSLSILTDVGNRFVGDVDSDVPTGDAHLNRDFVLVTSTGNPSCPKPNRSCLGRT